MLPEPGTVKGLILIAFFVVTGGFTPCPIITLFILLLLLSKRAPSLISLVKTSLLSWVNTVCGAVGFIILAAALSINRFPALIATVLPTSRAFLPISFAASFPALRAVGAICLTAFDTNSFLKKPATVSNIPPPPITFLFIDPVLSNSSHILTISFLTPVLPAAKLAIRRDNISTNALGSCGITIATPLPTFASQIGLIIFLYFWLFAI